MAGNSGRARSGPHSSSGPADLRLRHTSASSSLAFFSLSPRSKALQYRLHKHGKMIGPRLINTGLRVLPKAPSVILPRPHNLQTQLIRSSPLSTFSKAPRQSSSLLRETQVLSAFKRKSSTYTGDQAGAGQRWDYKRLAIAGATIAGAVVLTDGFLNRDTRDSPLSPGEKSLLNRTFQYTGAGLIVTALTARGLFRSGFAIRMMQSSPWLVLGVGLVGSIGSMMATFAIPYDNTVPKHAAWMAFAATQGALLAPMYFFAPAILGKAALYTLGIVGSLSYVGATANSDKFLYLGGPLLAGVAVVALSSIAPMVLPATAVRTLVGLEAISLYGGLAVFSGFVLYECALLPSQCCSSMLIQCSLRR